MVPAVLANSAKTPSGAIRTIQPQMVTLATRTASKISNSDCLFATRWMATP